MTFFHLLGNKKRGAEHSAPQLVAKISTAAAEEYKESDYDDPNAVVIVKKVAEAVIHI